MTPKEVAKLIFTKGLQSVLPMPLVKKTLKVNKNTLTVEGKSYLLNNNVFLVGFGKAVLGMAKAAEEICKNHLQKGIISVPVNINNALSNSTFKEAKDMLLSCESKIVIREGAKNNLPDFSAMETAFEIECLVKSLQEDDILIVLISGGGSALLPAPVNEISLEDKLKTIKLLSNCGATIQELNTIRKQLSRLKGGKLATIAKSKSIISLIFSDIVGDPMDLIASGPTFPDNSTPADCISILRSHDVMAKIPANVKDYLLNGDAKALSPLNSEISHVQNIIIGNNKIALNNCKMMAESRGYPVIVLTDQLTGNVKTVAEYFAETLFCLIHDKKPNDGTYFDHGLFDTANKILKSTGKICLLAAGETTVYVSGSGNGGRNQELVLWTAMLFEKLFKKFNMTPEMTGSFCFLSAGTDGQDGPTPAAGAFFTNELFTKAMQQGLDIKEYLDINGSYDFFSKLSHGSELLITGLTGTNVMDIQILLVEGS